MLACGVVAEGGCSGWEGTDPQPVEQLMEPGPSDSGAVLTSGVAGRGLLARTAWSFVGQGLSSASNFFLSVLVLWQGTEAQFATLSVVFTIYTFFVLLMRAAVGLPVTLLFSKDFGEGRQPELRVAAGASFGASVLVAAGMLAAGALSSGNDGQWLVLGATMPLLLLQDTARYVCFAAGKPRVAAEADGLWVFLQVAGSAAVLLLADPADAGTAYLAVWAGAGALSGCFLLRRTSLRPAPAAGLGWWRAHRALTTRLVVDFSIGAGSHYAVFFGLAVVAGAAELGRLKAAQTFLGPLIVLLLGGAVLGVPESVRAEAEPARLWQLTVRLAAALVGAAVACGTVVYLALPLVGPSTFPDVWEGARPVIPVLTVFAAAIGASTGAISGLRATAQNGWIMRVRVATGPVLVVASIPASAALGVNGALGVLSITEWFVVVLAWRRLRQVLAKT